MTGAKGVVFDVKRYAIHDGPGIRTTIFLKGCPLRCHWCHNPESWKGEPELIYRASRCTGCGQCIEACPNGAVSRAGEKMVTDPALCTACGKCVEVCPAEAREISGGEISVGELIRQIERDTVFFDTSGGGVTVSGGEPLAQPGFLRALLAACREREIHTALDTTCHAPWEVIESVLPDVSLFLCDIKLMDPAAHERFTGVSNELILDNITRLARSDSEISIRIPVIPGVNDSDENLDATGRFIHSLDRALEVDILPYNEAVYAKIGRLLGDFRLPEFDASAHRPMEEIREKLGSWGISVQIGG